MPLTTCATLLRNIVLDFSVPSYDLGILACGAIIAGIWLLVVGGDWAVKGAVAIAQQAKLSRMFIGATIVAFGTSVPELFTSINANLSGFPGLSLGNVVGSNIANVLLVIGATALFATLAAHADVVKRDLAIMLIATAILVGGMLYGVFTLSMGLAMFSLLVGFTAWQYFNNEIDVDEVEDVDASIPLGVGFLLGGFLGLAIGSEILVKGAVTLGNVVGIPEAVIGLTVVAIGTSLPELFTCAAAAFRRETDLIFGNIIGSNTFNVLSIVGLTAIVKPLEVAPSLAGAEMWFMVLVSVGFAAWLMMSRRINRSGGVGLLVCYTLFTLWLYRGALGIG